MQFVSELQTSNWNAFSHTYFGNTGGNPVVGVFQKAKDCALIWNHS